jgi:hypothetical protein
VLALAGQGTALTADASPDTLMRLDTVLRPLLGDA